MTTLVTEGKTSVTKEKNFLFTFAAALGRGRLHAHAEPSEFISFRVGGYGGSVTVCVIVVGPHGGRGGGGSLALSLQSVKETKGAQFVFTFGARACFRGSILKI